MYVGLWRPSASASFAVCCIASFLAPCVEDGRALDLYYIVRGKNCRGGDGLRDLYACPLMFSLQIGQCRRHNCGECELRQLQRLT